MRKLVMRVVSTGAVLALVWFIVVWAVPDVPTVVYSREALAICRTVEASGAVPFDAVVFRSESTAKRFVLVYGVMDRAAQDGIVRAAAVARRSLSSRPVEVVFHSATIHFEKDGGVAFPNGAMEVRRVTIP